MNKESNSTASSVISVNPYQNSFVRPVANVLQKSSSIEYDKNQYLIAYLSSKEYIDAKISLSINIPDEDLEDALYNKAYDELGLDQAVEYMIRFIEIESELDAENRYFYLFVVDPNDIKATFENIEKKVHYIDMIIPNALLYKPLYTKEILATDKTDIFIYLEEDDSSITFYKDGEFVYTKSLPFSYKQIHEKFCELYGESIPYNDFLNFLTATTLKDSKSKYKKDLFAIFKEFFTRLNEIITYVKRAYALENIDHLYIDSAINTPTKLHELAEVELELYASDFDFFYGFKKDVTFIEPMHALMQLHTKMDEDQRYNINFTLYERPPKLVKRSSGKIILVVLLALLVAFAYPVFNWIVSSTHKIQEDKLQSEYNTLHKNKKEREDKLNSLYQQKKEVTSLLNEEKKEYNEKKATLIKIHDVKANYPMKAKIIASFTRYFNLYDVEAKAISYDEEKDEKSFNLYLVAQSDKDITKLVKHLTQDFKAEYKFSLEKIYLEKNSHKYFTELQVTII